MKRRAVFLDRDGVINEAIVRDGKPYPPANVREVVLVPDAEMSLASLKSKGFLLIVVTNQPDVRRGTITRDAVEQIHRFLSTQLPLDDVFACYHDDRDKCSCRKPLPGLIQEAALKYRIDVSSSYMVGDRWRDIQAGAAAGCRTIFIDRHYSESNIDTSPDITVASLTKAVQRILGEEGRSSESWLKSAD